MRLIVSCQSLESNLIAVEQPHKCMLEKHRILSVVIPPRNLFHIAGKVLSRYFMVGTHNRPLQQRPRVLDRVSVNLAVNPSLRVLFPALPDSREAPEGPPHP